jgi:hypothetical protein
MNSISIQSKDLGLLLLDGLPAKTTRTTSLARSTKSFILPKILEALGTILRVMCLISPGEQQNSLRLLVTKTLKQESLSQLTQTLEATKELKRDGTKTSTFTTQMTFSRPSIKPLTQETASS